MSNATPSSAAENAAVESVREHLRNAIQIARLTDPATQTEAEVGAQLSAIETRIVAALARVGTAKAILFDLRRDAERGDLPGNLAERIREAMSAIAA